MRVLVEGGYKEYSMVSKLHIYLVGVYQTPAKFCWAFLFGLARLFPFHRYPRDEDTCRRETHHNPYRMKLKSPRGVEEKGQKEHGLCDSLKLQSNYAFTLGRERCLGFVPF